MTTDSSPRRGVFSAPSRAIITAAAVAVLLAAAKEATVILVPFLMALFLSVVLSLPLGALSKRGVPTWLAVLIVVLVSVGVGTMLVGITGASLNDFSSRLPAYTEKLNNQVVNLNEVLEKVGMEISQEEFRTFVNPGMAMRMAAGFLSGIGDVFTKSALILLVVVFILIESKTFPGKLRVASSDPDTSMAKVMELIDTIKEYMRIKTYMSLLTGVVVASFLFLCKIEYALLWGVFAFLLNYVPTIGSTLAGIPPVLLGVVNYGFGPALGIAAVILVINITISNVLEPKFLGEGLGISTLVVILSLVFWGWMFGPVGMFLSVPLTMTFKIILASNPTTAPVAILLGKTADPTLHS